MEYKGQRKSKNVIDTRRVVRPDRDLLEVQGIAKKPMQLDEYIEGAKKFQKDILGSGIENMDDAIARTKADSIHKGSLLRKKKELPSANPNSYSKKKDFLKVKTGKLAPLK